MAISEPPRASIGSGSRRRSTVATFDPLYACPIPKRHDPERPARTLDDIVHLQADKNETLATMDLGTMAWDRWTLDRWTWDRWTWDRGAAIELAGDATLFMRSAFGWVLR